MKIVSHIPTDNRRNSNEPQRQTRRVPTSDSLAVQLKANWIGIGDTSSSLGLQIHSTYCSNPQSNTNSCGTGRCKVEWGQGLDILSHTQWQRNLHNLLVVNNPQVVPIRGYYGKRY